MVTNELVLDSFDRINQIVHRTVEGLSIEELSFRPNNTANSITWLVWHIARVQDSQLSGLANTGQIWEKDWFDKFKLPLDVKETGYGHTSEKVASIKVESTLLLGYLDDVYNISREFIQKLQEVDYDKIVDKNWTPPVTLSARLVSTISDCLQHAGQAAYIKGLLS